MTDTEAFQEAVSRLHAQLDRWAAAVEGVAAEAADSSEALADPRLEAAQDGFYEALAGFETASLPVLGLVPDDDIDLEPGSALSSEDLFLHFRVELDPQTVSERLQEAFDVVQEGGSEITERLSGAGFEVSLWGASTGEPALGLIEDDEEDEP